MHDLIFAIDIEKGGVSRLLIIHTVNYHYGGIIGKDQPNVDTAGKRAYHPPQKTETVYDTGVVPLALPPLDSSQKQSSGASWGWS